MFKVFHNKRFELYAHNLIWVRHLIDTTSFNLYDSPVGRNCFIREERWAQQSRTSHVISVSLPGLEPRVSVSPGQSRKP